MIRRDPLLGLYVTPHARVLDVITAHAKARVPCQALKVPFFRSLLEQNRRYGVRFKPPKSRSSRRVLPATERLLAVLKEYRAIQKLAGPNDFVFSEAGGPWTPDTFSKQFSVIMRQVGIAGFRLHDARHAFASLALKNGTSIKEVAELLGHASPSSRYQRTRT